MHTYLVICGILLPVLVLLVIIGCVISELNARKYNKEKAAEKAKKDAAYKAEMVLAKPIWEKWAKRYAELEQSYDKDSDPIKRIRIHIEIAKHVSQRYRSASTGNIPLLSLGERNAWTLEEEPVQQTA